ncbi:MAG: GNAT family protein [Candidatus Diapherotrites archaeon]|nr:GNAT family protein [Candidatus Diapherotrites archaeon]
MAVQKKVLGKIKSKPQIRKSKQLSFRFRERTHFHSEKVQALLGKYSKAGIHSFFRMGKQIVGEVHGSHGAKVFLFSLNETFRPKQLLATGSLYLPESIYSSFPEFLDFKKKGQVLELGYNLQELTHGEVQGRGLAQTVANCLIEQAKKLKLHGLVARVEGKNPASHRILRKAGFRRFRTEQVPRKIVFYYLDLS